MSDFLNIFFLIILTSILSYKLAIIVRGNWIYFFSIVHYFFTIAYYLYVQKYGGDANMYFAQAKIYNSWNSLEDFGTEIIIFISAFFVQFLSFSKFALFILFGFFGYIGFYFFVKMIWSINYNNRIKYIYAVLFLPGFHFWTSALGKDSLIFMFIMLFFYSLSMEKLKFFLLIFSLVGVYIIRPHIAMIILLSFSLVNLFSNPLKFDLLKFLFLIFSVIAIFLLKDSVIRFVGIDTLDAESITQKIEMYNNYGASNVNDESSYIDVTSYSIPSKLFAYMFRPFFFDARSILQFIVSVENLFIVLLVFMWFKNINFRLITWYLNLKISYKIMTIYFILGWIILALNMYNLGLAFRQKYMLLPILFILVLGNNLFIKKTNHVRH